MIEGVLALLHELLADRATGVRGEVLERRRVGGVGGHDDRVLHRAVLFQDADDLRDLRRLLADGDVDADHVAALLGDDRVQADRRSCR